MRNNRPVLNFDDTTNESIMFSGVFPQCYGGGGVTAYIHYSMASSCSSGDVDWDVAFERVGTSESLDADGFAAAQSADNNVIPDFGNLAVASIDFEDGAEMDNVAVGEVFRVKLTRDATNDTATGDAEFYALEIREQS